MTYRFDGDQGKIPKKALKILASHHEYRAFKTNMTIADKVVYRIALSKPSGSGTDTQCTVTQIGKGFKDYPDEGHYESASDLPEWMQSRLAALHLMSGEPPTEDVEGVGRRMSKTVFWVYK